VATEQLQMTIKGLACSQCVSAVENALRAKSGVTEVYLDPESGQAQIRVEQGQVTRAELVDTVKKMGYEVQ
jgi:copper chaperone CopZ